LRGQRFAGVKRMLQRQAALSGNTRPRTCVLTFYFQRPPRQRRPPPVPFNYKTRMCLTYASGKQCEMGYRCKFAHGPEELRAADPPRAPNARYKTKLCKNFGPYASNYCPYGLRCEFIHPNDKEYALVVRPYSLAVSDRYAVLRFQCPASSHPPTRNSTKAENLSQNMCNVTPETVCDGPPIAVTRTQSDLALPKAAALWRM
uniref:Tristetraprolin n=1 Tax=Heligmosomoides polygyrus TaxID=6339 RepID=A0A8L8Q5S9_HELPZ